MFPLDPASNIILSIGVIAFGLLLGSFFNVLVWRLPRGESIVFPGSHCPYCKRPVRPHENIPLASYVVLRGKCAGCKTHIPLRYPAVELLTALALFGLWNVYLLPLLNTPATQWFHLVPALLQTAILLLLIPIAIIDLQHFLIFDIFTLPGILLGLGVSFLPGSVTPLQSFLGILAGGGSLYAVGMIGELLFKKEEAMGGGDVKLMAMAGAFWGWQIALETIVFGSLLGALFGGLQMIMRKMREDHRIPFGPFLAAGLWVAVIAGDTILQSYFMFIERLLPR